MVQLAILRNRTSASGCGSESIEEQHLVVTAPTATGGGRDQLVNIDPTQPGDISFANAIDDRMGPQSTVLPSSGC
jgi:hypothetical protein